MYTEDLWNAWCQQEEENYKIVLGKDGKAKRVYLKKGYCHFDHKFWFPSQKSQLQKILLKGLRVYSPHHKRDEWWAFSPFLKMLIKTPRYKFDKEAGRFGLETKIRPICFAAHLDSLIFSYYAFALTRKYEDYIDRESFDECVLAYRSNLNGKCNIQFAKEVFDFVKTKGECAAIALDIKGYFDHINHKILKEKWVKVIGQELPEDQYKIFKAVTKYSYITKNSVLRKYNIDLRKITPPPLTLLEIIPGSKDYQKFDRLRQDHLIVRNDKPNKKTGTHIGVPQGSALSALLSNIYLIDFDEMMFKKSKEEGFLYRRYCDDIMIVCDIERGVELLNFTINNIKSDYGLTIQEKKVELTEFFPNSKGKIRAFNRKKLTEDGIDRPDATNEKYFYKSLQYLGFEFNGQSIFIRSSSLSRYFRKLKSRIVKTVSMAYSKKSTSPKIWKEQLLHRYSHLGKRNFLSYAYNASKKEYTNAKGDVKEGMNSKAIRRQLRHHMTILQKTLKDKNIQRFVWKAKGKRPMKLKIA